MVLVVTSAKMVFFPYYNVIIVTQIKVISINSSEVLHYKTITITLCLVSI